LVQLSLKHPDDLTGLFCTSRTERLEEQKGTRNHAEEDVHARADRGQAAPGDLQYLVTDGESFFHDEKRNLESKLERLPLTGVRICGTSKLRGEGAQASVVSSSTIG
jgi:hypothetical protein